MGVVRAFGSDVAEDAACVGIVCRSWDSRTRATTLQRRKAIPVAFVAAGDISRQLTLLAYTFPKDQKSNICVRAHPYSM